MKKLPKLKRGIKAHEVLRAFNSKGKKVKFSANANRVLKVYDKRQRKYVGTYNKTSKSGRPIPKLFGTAQFRMYQLLRSDTFTRPSGRGVSFSVNPKRHIKFQIPNRIVSHVNKHAIHGGKSFQVAIIIKTSDGRRESHTRNPAYLLTKGNSNSDIRKILTNEAICAAVINNLRFSDVVHARGKNKIKRQIVEAKIRITYANAPKEIINAKKGRNTSKRGKVSRSTRANKKGKKSVKR